MAGRAMNWIDRPRQRVLAAVGVMSLFAALTGCDSTPDADPNASGTGNPPTIETSVGPDGVPTHTVTGTGAPIELVDGWFVVGNALTLDRTTGSYVELRLSTVLPSPDGNWIATSGSGGVRIRDISGNESQNHQLNVNGASIAWSPDSGTLLVAGTSFIPEPNRPVGSVMAALIDVDAETVRYRYPDVLVPCSACPVDMHWLPSGDEIVLLPPQPEGLRTFNKDLFSHRTLPIAGSPLGTGAWSPDGRLVIVHDSAEEQGHVVDVETGAVVQRMEGRRPVQAQWIDNERYLTWEALPAEGGDRWSQATASLWTLGGTEIERWILPIELVRLDRPDLDSTRLRTSLPQLVTRRD